MGCEVDAFLGPLEVLRQWKKFLPSALIFPLNEDVGLVPVWGKLLKDIAAVLPSVKDGLEGAWCAEVSKGCTIACMSLFEFGDEGDASGSAAVSAWTNQKRVEPDCSVNTALHLMGVEAAGRLDEFDTVGLGRYRKTETWAAAAILNDLVTQSGGRFQGLLIGLAYEQFAGVRMLAAGELSALGVHRATLIPKLAERARIDPDYGVRLRCISALEFMGAEGVPALIGLLAPGQLQHQDQDRWCVILSLGRIGAAAAAASPDLVNILRSEPIAEQRARAAEALGAIGPDARQAIPALTDAIRDSKDSVRFHAVRSLEKMNPEASQVIPALLPTLHDSYNLVVEVAADWLKRLGAAKAAVPELIDVLQTSRDYKLRVNAAVSLGKFGSEADSAVAALIKGLDDENVYVRNQSAVALGRVGPAARAAIPVLKELLNSKDQAVAKSARQSMDLLQAK